LKPPNQYESKQKSMTAASPRISNPLSPKKTNRYQKKIEEELFDKELAIL
jgi:hypothetical protein